MMSEAEAMRLLDWLVFNSEQQQDLVARDSAQHVRQYIEQLEDEVKRLESTLQKIKSFGHTTGHGRGYTCASMASEALERVVKEGKR